MTFIPPPLDFIVRKEDWCRYDLSDGAILKVKIILTKIHKVGKQYSADFQIMYVVLTNEIGTPDTTMHTPQQLQASIQKEIGFTTTAQDWNEYVSDDGARIKIQPMLARVDKTSKFNGKGEPIYLNNIQGNIQITPPPASSP